MDHFLRTVPTGRGQVGIQSFLDCYLDSMLTCGRAVGEIVPDRSGRSIAAVLCGNVSRIEIKEGDTPEILQRRVMEEAEWKILPAAAEKVSYDIMKSKGN